MNYKDTVIEKLKLFSKEDIIISHHTRIRLCQRQISEQEIVENIINPRRLEYAVKEEAKNPGEEKFDCYFGYSKTLCHRYVLVIKDKVIVITIVRINRKWQIIAEKKMKNP
jgi:hypothetical protein